MQVFVDIITRSGAYLPAKQPVWIDAGVGKLVPAVCRMAARSGNDVCSNMAVYHVEESRFLEWPGFSETCVRDFDTVVVVGTHDQTFEDPKEIEGYWLVTEGMDRRTVFEAEHKLRAYYNGRPRRRPTVDTHA